MHWNEIDSIRLFGGDVITYFKSDDGDYLRLEFKDGFDQVNTICSGTYIALQLEKDGDLYYALSKSNTPDIQPDKIYIKEKN